MGVCDRPSGIRIHLGLASRLATNGCRYPLVSTSCRSLASPVPQDPFHLFLSTISRLGGRACLVLCTRIFPVRGVHFKLGALGSAEPRVDGLVCRRPPSCMVRAVAISGRNRAN